MIFPSKMLSVNINNICFHFQSRHLVQTSHLLPFSQKMRSCFHTPGTNLAKTSKLFASTIYAYAKMSVYPMFNICLNTFCILSDI